MAAIDLAPPDVVWMYPRNDSEKVDPDDVHRNGIQLVFTEFVAGTIDLMDEHKNALGWLSAVDENKMTLRGSGLELGTEYYIVGRVTDAGRLNVCPSILSPEAFRRVPRNWYHYENRCIYKTLNFITLFPNE